MLIVRINRKKIQEPLDDLTASELADRGVTVENLEPSAMSFLTSMRIAAGCKKRLPDFIMAYTVSDAIGAISARELIRKRGMDFKIIYRTTVRSPLPHTITSDIRKGVDIWMFDSESTRDAWKSVATNVKTTVAPWPCSTFHVKQYIQEAPAKTKPELIFLGLIDRAANLGKIIGAMANLEAGMRPPIRVAGTGKARYVMPAVRKARLMELDITWLGDNYDVEAEIARADGFILSDSPYSTAELRALSSGVPPVTAANLAEWTDSVSRASMSRKAVEYFTAHHSPAEFANLLKSLRG